MYLFRMGRRNIDIQDLSIWTFFFLIFICGPVALSIDIRQSDALSASIYATQTAEIARAEATSEALAHAAETASAVTDITAVLDEDPTLVGPVEAVALQLHAVSPLTRGLRYRESFKVVVAGRHISIPRGSTVTLRCGDDPTQLLCQVVAVATPTP